MPILSYPPAHQSRDYNNPTPFSSQMSAAANTVSDSDESSNDSCFFEIFTLGKRIGVILVPRNDISFKSIRHEIMEDEIPVPKHFRFTLEADGKPFSLEQEDNWWDWSVFTKQGENGTLQSPYKVFLEAGKT